MKRTASIAMVVLLAAGLVLIFVSPALDVPQTALRSQQHAARVLLGLVAIFSAILPLLALSSLAAPALEFGPVPSSISLVDFTCTRRC